jgi:oligosaccharyltransferase complex subunit gamma
MKRVLMDSNFQPSFEQVADSWRRQSKDVKNGHFFAQLDFQDGQAIYQRVSNSGTLG